MSKKSVFSSLSQVSRRATPYNEINFDKIKVTIENTVEQTGPGGKFLIAKVTYAGGNLDIAFPKMTAPIGIKRNVGESGGVTYHALVYFIGSDEPAITYENEDGESVTFSEDDVVKDFASLPIDGGKEGFLYRLQKKLVELLKEEWISKKLKGLKYNKESVIGDENVCEAIDKITKKILAPEFRKIKEDGELVDIQEQPYCKWMKIKRYFFKNEETKEEKLVEAPFTYPLKGDKKKIFTLDELNRARLYFKPDYQIREFYIQLASGKIALRSQIQSAVIYDIDPIEGGEAQAEDIEQAENDDEVQSTLQEKLAKFQAHSHAAPPDRPKPKQDDEEEQSSALAKFMSNSSDSV